MPKVSLKYYPLIRTARKCLHHFLFFLLFYQKTEESKILCGRNKFIHFIICTFCTLSQTLSHDIQQQHKTRTFNRRGHNAGHDYWVIFQRSGTKVLPAVKGLGGKISSLFFLHLYICYRASFLVSKSAHLSPKSRRFRIYRNLLVRCRSKN